ncbi:hypothetical protein [Methylobacterium sp. PvR107]|uniref:hypothetical protein n=1 Tax=Methylobacterium sp. PvR107 TaxID=2806597 RepID=UPI001AE68526|nr:hypothetical protein [Methylobacterium sp. PvR107]MBP1182320.1 hypothetical protein [Methylobacterium sp. PvR107]
MTEDFRTPGRRTWLDRVRPGACCLMAGRDGPDLVLLVSREGRRAALLLNRRSAEDRHLPVRFDLPPDADVLALRGAVIAPSGGSASGQTATSAAALHLGDGRTYLCGRDEFGRHTIFDVGSGLASAIDPAVLPRTRCWRVMVPEAGGAVTVYDAEPA